jgi:hypothetical protein
VLPHNEKRPSQWLVAGGAFCQIRFFGFLLRNSFDIAPTPMAAVGSKKIASAELFPTGFAAKEKGGIAAALP